MQIDHLRSALIAAAALAAQAGVPALAGTTVLPGTMCTSEGAVGRSLTGLMVNKVAGTGTTYFVCPIIRTQAHSYYPGTMSITVHVKTATNVAEFNCYMRSVTASNVTYDQVKIVFPGSLSGDYATTAGAQLNLPPVGVTPWAASVNMRCAVPNVIGGVEAGIVSYSFEQ